ncbi:hypothetical protein V8D89_004407 [Ganoderma adspersum]
MTFQSDADAVEMIAQYAAAFPDNYSMISVIAFVMYDGAVTLFREVQLFWGAKSRTLPAILYFSNKYLNVLSQIMVALELLPLASSDQSCSGVAVMSRMILYLSQISPAVFTASRAYALTRNRGLSIITLLLSSVSFVTNMLFQVALRFHVSSVYFIPTIGCSGKDIIPPSLVRMLTIANRTSSILADVILIMITWKLVPDSGIINHKGRSKTTKTKGLASIMLYNGMTNFVILSTLNILQLSFSGYLTSWYGESALTFLSAVKAPMTSVLVSHFLLDLQEAHQKTPVALATYDLLPVPTLQDFQAERYSIDVEDTFQSLGAIIDPPDWDEENDNEGVDYPLMALNASPSQDQGEATGGERRVEDELVFLDSSPLSS